MYITFDVGRTNIRVGTSHDLKNLEKTQIINSNDSLEKVAESISQVALELAGDEKIEILAGGITAVIDNTKGKRLSEILSQKFNAPVYIDNDTALVGLGEAHFGAGKGFSIVQYMTISTGIGGARIVDGKIDRSALGFEPGHQIIQFDGESKSTLEELASGRGVKQIFGKDPKEIVDEKIWNDLAYVLAVGVYNSMLHWSPEVIVLGGPMITGNPRIPFEKVVHNIQSFNDVYPKLPEIKMAELDAFGGLYGALNLLDKNLDFFG